MAAIELKVAGRDRTHSLRSPICARAPMRGLRDASDVSHASLTSQERGLERGRKRVSIEELLVWAYRDQMVHGAVSEAGLALGPVRDWLSSASAGWCVERVDGSAGQYTAHEDAFAVHRAVSELGWARVVLEPGPRVAPWLSGGFLPAYEREFSIRLSSLVMTTAMSGGAYDWRVDGALRVVRGGMLYRRGRNGMAAQDARGRRIIEQCLVSYEGPAPWVAERARAEYAAWRSALARLGEAVGAHVRTFAVSGALPPQFPWAGDCNSSKT